MGCGLAWEKARLAAPGLGGWRSQEVVSDLWERIPVVPHVRLLRFSHTNMTSRRRLFLSIELAIVHCYNALP